MSRYARVCVPKLENADYVFLFEFGSVRACDTNHHRRVTLGGISCMEVCKTCLNCSTFIRVVRSVAPAKPTPHASLIFSTNVVSLFFNIRTISN